MKAAVWHGIKDIRVEVVPDPVVEPDKVIVKVKACGICGSDLHEYSDGPIIIPTNIPDPLTGKTAPMILGHEFSGEIVEIGRNVKGWAIGDRVVIDPAIACWECSACKRQQYNRCTMLACTGLSENGAFAEYVSVRDYQLYRLNDTISWVEGAVVEPLAVGVHAVDRSNIAMGDSVLVVGTGAIGLAALQAARAAGAAEVYVIGGSQNRRKLAVQLGATKVYSADYSDIHSEVMSLTNGNGVNISFECVGKDETVNLCLQLTCRGGRVVVVGVFKNKSLIDCNQFSLYEKDIVGCRAYAGDFKTVISLLADGRLQAQPLVTKIIPLEKIVSEGFEALIGKQQDQIKVIVSY